MQRIRHALRAMAAIFVLLAAALALAAGDPGTLDTAFGGDGVVVTTMNPYGTLHDLAAQSDGMVVAVGQDRWNHASENIQWAVHRYDTDGDLDTGFGTNGRVALFGDEGNHRALGVAIDGDGKILVAGNAAQTAGSKKKPKVVASGAVVRLTTAGALDGSFGSNGKAYALEGAGAVALQSDGKIILAGSVKVKVTGKKSRAFALARFETDGDLDTTFGNDGVVVHDITKASSRVIGSGDDGIGCIAIDSQDRIIVTGRSTPDGSNADNDMWLVRYDSDGELDTTFGTNGKVLVGNSSELIVWQHVIDANDKIVVGGYCWDTDPATFVARYGTGGSLDSDFGTDGVYVYATSDDPLGGAVAIQSDGKIVVSLDLTAGQNDVSVVRITAGGALDTDFGTNGQADVAGDSVEDDTAYAIVIGASGRIVLGGHVLSAGMPTWELVAFNGG